MKPELTIKIYKNTTLIKGTISKETVEAAIRSALICFKSSTKRLDKLRWVMLCNYIYNSCEDAMEVDLLKEKEIPDENN